MEKIRLSDAIDKYCDHLKAKDRGFRTIKNHRQPLNRALEQWGNIYVQSITPKHIDQLFEGSGWGPSTRNLYLSTLRGGFISWCRRNQYLPRDYDPTEGWRNAKVPNTPKLWIEVEEFSDLLESCTNPRDRAVCALGLFTFARGSEISYLKVGDLDFDRNEVNLYRVKTKEWDVLPMSQELGHEATRWLHAYQQDTGTALQSDWFLIPARSKVPMAFDRTVNKLQPTGQPQRLRPLYPLRKPYEVVQRPLAAIGHSDKGAGAHTLRRSGARAWFEVLRDGGYDSALRKVQAMLGHRSVTMTERYLGLDLEKRQRNELLGGKVMFEGLYRMGKLARLEGSHDRLHAVQDEQAG